MGKEMKRKILVAIAIATVAIFTLSLAFPLITASATATSLPATAASVQAANKNTQTEQQTLAPNLLNWTEDFYPNAYNFSAQLLTTDFNYTWQQNTDFRLNFARLIEFNDTNGNGFFYRNDTILRDYGLRENITWSSITINWIPSVSLQLSISGTCNDPNNPFNVTVSATISHIERTVTFLGYNYTIHGLAVKYGLDITNYSWLTPFNSTYPADSRYLALVISLNSNTTGSVQCEYRWSDGSNVANNTENETTSVGTDTRVSEVYFVNPSTGVSYAKFNWFNGAWNGTQDVEGKSSFYRINDQMNVSIAFPYNNFTSGNISIDPYFEFFPPSFLPLLLIFSALAQMAAGQASSNVLLFGGIALAAVVVVVVAAVVLFSRRYQ
jgi:hypothetical protein